MGCPSATVQEAKEAKGTPRGREGTPRGAKGGQGEAKGLPAMPPGGLREPREEQEREDNTQARQLEAKARDEARDRDAKQALQAEPGELQRMIAERLAKSLRR